MKRIFMIGILFFMVACQPSEESIQKTIEETQAAVPISEPTETLQNLLIKPTNPNDPTKVPYKSPTSKPTRTKSPTPKPTKTADVQTIVNEAIDQLGALILDYTETDSITMIRPGKEAFEIEVKTSNYAKDSQPDVSFEIIKILADTFGQLTEGQLLHFIAGDVDKFSVIITTYSAEGDYKYQSRTYYETLIKLYHKRIAYNEWVQESNAGFDQ